MARILVKSQDLNSLKITFAISSQLNFLDWIRPLFIRSVRRFGLVEMSSIACANELGFSGSHNIAASPTTSGIEEVLDAMTGHPACIASNGGKPKPS